MASMLKNISQALADSLTACTWSSVTDAVTVQRANWPSFDVEDLVNPVIAITPPGYVVDRLARTSHQYDYQAAIFLGRHTPDNASADAMADLLEEMVDRIAAHQWATLAPGVTWPAGITSPQEIQVTLNPDEALQDRNVWRAVVMVTYRIGKAHA